MMLRAAPFLVLFASASGVASGMLLPLTFGEFSQHASCSCIGEVTSVEEVTEDVIVALGVPAPEAPRLNRLARIRVEKWIVESGCAGSSKDQTLAFSTEVHSSKPEVGHRYVIMPRSIGQIWAEVIYGRSVWEIGGEDQVIITYRNDFLIAPLALHSGEMARVPLASVERLLTRSLGGDKGE